MNQTNNISTRLSKIISQIIKSDCDSIEITTQNAKNWDSLNHLNLILALEEEFNISIDPYDFVTLYSDYKTILNFLEMKLEVSE